MSESKSSESIVSPESVAELEREYQDVWGGYAQQTLCFCRALRGAWAERDEARARVRRNLIRAWEYREDTRVVEAKVAELAEELRQADLRALTAEGERDEMFKALAAVDKERIDLLHAAARAEERAAALNARLEALQVGRLEGVFIAIRQGHEVIGAALAALDEGMGGCQVSEPRILTPEQVSQIGPTNQAEADLLATVRAAWAERDVAIEHNGELCEKLAQAEADLASSRERTALLEGVTAAARESHRIRQDMLRLEQGPERLTEAQLLRYIEDERRTAQALDAALAALDDWERKQEAGK